LYAQNPPSTSIWTTLHVPVSSSYPKGCYMNYDRETSTHRCTSCSLSTTEESILLGSFEIDEAGVKIRLRSVLVGSNFSTKSQAHCAANEIPIIVNAGRSTVAVYPF